MMHVIFSICPLQSRYIWCDTTGNIVGGAVWCSIKRFLERRKTADMTGERRIAKRSLVFPLRFFANCHVTPTLYLYACHSTFVGLPGSVTNIGKYYTSVATVAPAIVWIIPRLLSTEILTPFRRSENRFSAFGAESNAIGALHHNPVLRVHAQTIHFRLSSGRGHVTHYIRRHVAVVYNARCDWCAAIVFAFPANHGRALCDVTDDEVSGWAR